MVNAFIPSLLHASWRFFSRHPWQLFLTLLSISLGTAVMVAVDLANHSASASFAQSVDTVAGRMTHHLHAVEKNQGIDEAFYTQLRVQQGYRNSAPIVEGEFSLQGEQFTLLGIDAFAEPLFQSNLHANQPNNTVSAIDFSQLLMRPNSVVMSLGVAKRFGLALGDTLNVTIKGRYHTLLLQDVYADEKNAALEAVFLTDIATAQELLHKVGRLDRIELLLEDQQVDALRASLPKEIRLAANQASANALEQMTTAFRTNLTAMSLLAMLVGAFLVYNTMTFSVLQRRQQFAVERMLGVTGKQLFLHVLIEALVLGIIGGIIGVLLGVVLGQGLLILVTRTVADLYGAVDMHVLQLKPLLLVKGVGITLFVVILATLAPAREAAKTQLIAVNRRSTLEVRSRQLIPYFFLAGVLLILLGGLLIGMVERSLALGFIALFFIVMGYSLLIPLIVNVMLKLFNKLNTGEHLLWSLAVRGISSSLSRTNLAIAALAIAVSATVGVGIMISSFRASVADWLDMTLYSDVYISATNETGTKVEGVLAPFWLQKVQHLKGVATLSTTKMLHVKVNGLPIPLMVISAAGERKRFNLLTNDSTVDAIWQRYHQHDTVLVSEPFAYHQQLKRGDSFQWVAAQGQIRKLHVAGIFQDYSASQGMIVMSAAHYDYAAYGQAESHKAMKAISSIGLLLAENTDSQYILQQLRLWAKEDMTRPIRIRSDQEIRATSLAIFDRTFAITHVLRLLVILVAFVGVFSALMALFLEKKREYAVLRATGLTPHQLKGMIFLQTALMGLMAGIIALPLGWLMSEVLISVINQRSFGWTMSRSLSAMMFIYALLLSVGAALLAGIFPARKITALSLRQGLRDL